jgi:hypothetical protein
MVILSSCTLIAGAIIHDTANLSGVDNSVSGRAPDADNTEVSAPAIHVIERAIHPPPGVAFSIFDPPAFYLGVGRCALDVLIRMSLTRHVCQSLA